MICYFKIMDGSNETALDYECLLDEMDLLYSAQLIDITLKEDWKSRVLEVLKGSRLAVFDQLQSVLDGRDVSDEVDCDMSTRRGLEDIVDAFIDLRTVGIYMGPQSDFIKSIAS